MTTRQVSTIKRDLVLTLVYTKEAGLSLTPVFGGMQKAPLPEKDWNVCFDRLSLGIRLYFTIMCYVRSFPGGLAVKDLPARQEPKEIWGSIPGS